MKVIILNTLALLFFPKGLSMYTIRDDIHGCPNKQVTCLRWCREQGQRFGVCIESACNCFYSKQDEMKAKPWERGCLPNGRGSLEYCVFWCRERGYISGKCFGPTCRCIQENGNVIIVDPPWNWWWAY